MATTTPAAICARFVALITGIAPTSQPVHRFIEHRNELGADFRAWAVLHPDAALRRFQVRETGERLLPAITNLDVEQHIITIELLFAYPQNHRWGPNARDRDRVIGEDWLAIERAIGRGARASFSPPDYPDAYWRSARIPRRETRGAIDFHVITQTMGFMLAL